MGAAGVVALVAATACASSPAPPQGKVAVVAAENFWGSLASQLGGAKAYVQSIVTDPSADPHEYESGAADARSFADADLVIVNGAGYDGWAQKLLDSNPASGRRVVSVAAVLGKRTGDNPHFWYDPGAIPRVADAITAALRSLDAQDAAYFDTQRSAFTAALQPFQDEVAAIKRRFSGTPIASTETVFLYMAASLGLDVTTPVAFMQAVSAGYDPPASALAAFHDQISARQVKVLVYNLQTATAVTTNLKDLASARHIATVGVTETLQPQHVTFQAWQLAELTALEHALNSAS